MNVYNELKGVRLFHTCSLCLKLILSGWHIRWLPCEKGVQGWLQRAIFIYINWSLESDPFIDLHVWVTFKHQMSADIHYQRMKLLHKMFQLVLNNHCLLLSNNSIQCAQNMFHVNDCCAKIAGWKCSLHIHPLHPHYMCHVPCSPFWGQNVKFAVFKIHTSEYHVFKKHSDMVDSPNGATKIIFNDDRWIGSIPGNVKMVMSTWTFLRISDLPVKSAATKCPQKYLIKVDLN